MRFEVRQAARNDLSDIATYIARDNPERAVSFIEELLARIEMVFERPLSFPARGELGAGVRSAIHGRYLIFFRVSERLIEILRVLHGARDIDYLLES